MKYEDMIAKQKDDAHILVEQRDRVLSITLNRPSRQNAITTFMYSRLTQLINDASSDNSIQVIHLKGLGPSFSSGNDLGNFMMVPPEIFMDPVQRKDIVVMMGKRLLLPFVNAFIQCTKPIVAQVHGNVVGIAFTILGLCDLVYATHDATFRSPLLQLALGPEGGSSYTFTKLLGKQKAFEYLVLGESLSSQQLFNDGLVNRCFPDGQSMDTYVQNKLKFLAGLDYQAIIHTKRLMNITENKADHLKYINKQESENWAERCAAEAMLEATLNMMASQKQRKQKSKL